VVSHPQQPNARSYLEVIWSRACLFAPIRKASSAVAHWLKGQLHARTAARQNQLPARHRPWARLRVLTTAGWPTIWRGKCHRSPSVAGRTIGCSTVIFTIGPSWLARKQQVPKPIHARHQPNNRQNSFFPVCSFTVKPPCRRTPAHQLFPAPLLIQPCRPRDSVSGSCRVASTVHSACTSEGNRSHALDSCCAG